MNLRLLAVAAVVMTALAGCGGGPRSHTQPSASPSMNGHATALDLSKCMRANGYPNFPDPVQDDQGTWTIPEVPGLPTSTTVCDALWRSFKQDEKVQQLAALDLPKRREFAKCMRAHGVPDFPDPDEEGNFDLPDRVRQADRNNDPTLRAADKACDKYFPPQAPKPRPSKLTAMSMAVLTLRDVRKTYPGDPPVESVRGVNLDVEAGGMLAIRGSSGSGKSTLLNLMSALDRPTSGSVILDGQPVEDLSDRDLAGLRAHRVGVVFQRFFLLESLTARENVATGLLYRGVRPPDRRVAATGGAAPGGARASTQPRGRQAVRR